MYKHVHYISCMYLGVYNIEENPFNWIYKWQHSGHMWTYHYINNSKVNNETYSSLQLKKNNLFSSPSTSFYCQVLYWLKADTYHTEDEVSSLLSELLVGSLPFCHFIPTDPTPREQVCPLLSAHAQTLWRNMRNKKRRIKIDEFLMSFQELQEVRMS